MSILPWIATGLGALGTLAGGGGEQTQTIERKLSPEAEAYIKFLMGQYDRNPYDVSGIVSSTRERIGNESSGLRQAALQRLTRAGVPAMQRESALGDITTAGLREVGSTVADLQFNEQAANEERRSKIMQILAGIYSGTGTSTATTTPPAGAGFSQLFGAGLQGLMGTYGVPKPSGGSNTPGNSFYSRFGNKPL